MNKYNGYNLLSVKDQKEKYCLKEKYCFTVKDILKEENNNKYFIDENNRIYFVSAGIIYDEAEVDIVKNNKLKDILELKLKKYEIENFIALDQPILVRDNLTDEWRHMHFAKCEDGKVYTWNRGCTSWSAKDNKMSPWEYYKIPKKEMNNNGQP